VRSNRISVISLTGAILICCVPSAMALGANVECPVPRLAPSLDASYHECSHGFQDGSCDTFVEVFSKLLPRFDCQRDFDNAPVPAVWLIDEAAFEDYVHLLSKMKTTAARKLFGSAAFRSVLDGALAEDYGALSRKVERELRGGPTP
jgi:hypothetical protein